MSIDPRFQRIASRLSAFELVAESEDDLAFSLTPEDPLGRASTRFLGYYSRDGIRRALEAYGVDQRLQELGLGSYEISIECADNTRHRAQVLLDGVNDDEHRLIDLIIRPMRVKDLCLTEKEGCGGATYDVLLVEWLELQNPRACFSRRRPRLPGQRHPGLGLGYAFHNLTLLMAQRLGRDGVVNIPERLHLAVIYQRVGYHYTCERHRNDVQGVVRSCWRLHFAALAWAAERGLIRALDDVGGAHAWGYQSAEMVAAVSTSLAQRLGSPPGVLRHLVGPRPQTRCEVDLAGLRASLRDDPVEGMDPADLLRGPG